jgi:hypothetical protein
MFKVGVSSMQLIQKWISASVYRKASLVFWMSIFGLFSLNGPEIGAFVTGGILFLECMLIFSSKKSLEKGKEP